MNYQYQPEKFQQRFPTIPMRKPMNFPVIPMRRPVDLVNTMQPPVLTRQSALCELRRWDPMVAPTENAEFFLLSLLSDALTSSNANAGKLIQTLNQEFVKEILSPTLTLQPRKKTCREFVLRMADVSIFNTHERRIRREHPCKGVHLLIHQMRNFTDNMLCVARKKQQPYFVHCMLQVIVPLAVSASKEYRSVKRKRSAMKRHEKKRRQLHARERQEWINRRNQRRNVIFTRFRAPTAEDLYVPSSPSYN